MFEWNLVSPSLQITALGVKWTHFNVTRAQRTGPERFHIYVSEQLLCVQVGKPYLTRGLRAPGVGAGCHFKAVYFLVEYVDPFNCKIRSFPADQRCPGTGPDGNPHIQTLEAGPRRRRVSLRLWVQQCSPRYKAPAAPEPGLCRAGPASSHTHTHTTKTASGHTFKINHGKKIKFVLDNFAEFSAESQ